MNYFITYGDEHYIHSARRLADEAERLHLFDRIQAFSPADLPAEVKAHPLMHYARGGGYWYWKPCLIRECLRQMQPDDILVYADSGCTVQPSHEWARYFRDLRTKSIVVFRLGYKNKWFCRRNLMEYAIRHEPHWGEYLQVLGGFLVMRKTETTCRLVDDWARLMGEHPEFVTDVTEKERTQEAPYFRENRHDQSALNACLYRYRAQVKIRWENVERIDPFRQQAVIASRLSDKNPHRVTPKYTWGKYLIRTLVGKPLALLQQMYWERRRP